MLYMPVKNIVSDYVCEQSTVFETFKVIDNNLKHFS